MVVHVKKKEAKGCVPSFENGYSCDGWEAQNRGTLFVSPILGCLPGAALGASIGNIVPGIGIIPGAIAGCFIGGGMGAAAGSELPPYAAPFKEGEATTTPVDPLILDLNGDGEISTTTVTNGAYFDMDCSGFAEQIAWADIGDGVLVRDVDNDGWITDGKELFGDQTILANGNTASNGFQALADLDSNGDNKIDVNDTTFAELGVIKDGEFFYLGELGITEISLNTTGVNEEQNGNTLVKTADFIKNGETFKAGEFNLQSNTFYTVPIEYDESVDLTTVEDLPEALGYGNVHNLNYAMAADETGELKALVEEFIYMGPDTENVLTQSERYVKVDEILEKWANPQGYVVNRGQVNETSNFTSTQLAILEEFMGEPFRESYDTQVNTDAIPSLEASYSALKEEVYARLMAQSHLKGFYDNIFVIETIDEVDYLVFTLDDAAQQIKDKVNVDNDPEEAKLLLQELTRSLKALGFNKNTEYDEFYNTISNDLGGDYTWILDSADKTQRIGSSSSEIIEGTSLAEAIQGLDGDDTIKSRQGDDFIFGGDGNDSIDSCYDNDYVNGGNGDDTIDGGTGNDTLHGGVGNDMIFADSGNDILYGNTGFDELTGGRGNDSYYIDEYDTIIEEYNYGVGGVDTVYTNFSYTLGSFVENLTLTGTADINATGNGDNNTLEGNSGTNTLTGMAGDDTYIIDSTNDTIIENAGEGNDTVITDMSYTLDNVLENLTLTGTSALEGVGNAKDNVLKGNNQGSTLIGKDGNDTYYLYGTNDSIVELTGEGTDTVNSTVDYTLGNNLENIVLSGTYDINATGNNLNNNIKGNLYNNTLTGLAGSDTLAGDKGNDYYIIDSDDNVTEYYNEGIDTVETDFNYTLQGHFENIILSGSSDINATGNDLDNSLTGNSGINTLTGGKGNDTYVVDSTDDIIVELAGEGDDTVIISSSYTISNNIENIILSGTASLIAQGNNEDNYLEANDGASTLIGGQGNDSYYVNSSDDIVTENANEGEDSVTSTVSYTLDSAVEDLYLGGTEDSNASGNNKDNYIMGNSANNTLDGGIGTDTLKGGAGNDTYIIDSTNDVVSEESFQGNDTVITSFDYTLGNSLENLILSGDSSVTLAGNTLANSIVSNGGDDYIFSSSGHDTIDCGAGNDIINAGKGDDLIECGIGNDSNSGGQGNDTFIFNPGDGQDTIYDHSGSDDNLKLDVLQSEVNFSLQKNESSSFYTDLVINFNNNNEDKIILKEIDYSGTLKDTIEKITFSDDSILTMSEILDNKILNKGTDQDDSIEGSEYLSNNIASYAGNDTIKTADGDDVIDAGSGDDDVDSGRGNDSILGGAGNDTINGGYGDDSIEGGIGNDSISGLNGDNTFIFNLGDGHDTIYAPYGDDNLKLDVLQNEVNFSLKRTGSYDYYTNLIIDFNNSEDKIIIEDIDYRGTLEDNIEKITFFDNSTLSMNDILDNKILNKGTDQDDFIEDASKYLSNNIASYAGNDTINTDLGDDTIDAGSGNDDVDSGRGNDSILGGSGDDSIYSNDGADTVYGGTGNDSIDAGYGDDSIECGIGNDYINGSEGNDTFIFNLGDGNDTIYAGSGDDNLKLDVLQDDVKFSLQKQDSSGYTNNYTDLVIDFDNSEDKIVIGGIYYEMQPINILEKITFYDNSTLTMNDILDNKILNEGTPGPDNIVGSLYLSNTIKSYDGNDTILGGQGDDLIEGGPGNDTYIINSWFGQDTITDTSGIDTIKFGETLTESNKIFTNVNGDLEITFANSPNDKITVVDYYSNDTNKIENFEFFIDTIDGDSDSNILIGTAEDDLIRGYEGDDILSGKNGDDNLLGGTGNDILLGDQGNDTLTGDLGNDTYVINDANDIINEDLSSGTDTVCTSLTSYTLATNIENLKLIGYEYDDDIQELVQQGKGSDGTGNSLNNYILGNDLNNQINGKEGIDTLEGGAGDDTYQVDNTADQIFENPNEGIDLVKSEVSYSLPYNVENLILVGPNAISAIGNSSDNTLTGNSISNELVGYSGDDYILGEDGNDTIDSGSGNDIIVAGAGNDTINSGSEDDSIEAGTGDDSIYSSAGADTINAGVGRDTIYGCSGNNTYIFNNGDGQDTIFDENGIDIIEFGSNIAESNAIFTRIDSNLEITFSNNPNDKITVIDYYSNNLYKIESFEFINSSSVSIQGSSANDTLNGTNDSNNIQGYEGNDVIYGKIGNDTIDAGSGSDIIEGGIGNDSLSGSDGNDTYIFNLNDEHDTITDTNGIDTIKFGSSIAESDKIFNNVDGDLEVTFANNPNDKITVIDHYSNTANKIETFELIGDTNSNTLIGTIEDDIIRGLEENDILSGKEGNDSLEGGTGDDILLGDQGNDTLAGGIGNDIYIVSDANNIINENSNAGTDTIYSSVNSYTLDTNIENLTLIGYEYDKTIQDFVEIGKGSNGIGNNLDNYINGNDLANQITGEKGDDTVEGGAGDDIYNFNSNDGVDIINDSSGVDKIHFESASIKDTAVFYKDGIDLYIDYGQTDGEDQIIVQGQDSIERVELSSGEYLTNADINQLIIAVTDYAIEHEITLSSFDDVRNNQNLMNIVTTAWHS